jgi:hypothetical protein
MQDPGDFVTDYSLSFEPMAALGWRTETVVWNDTSINWDSYDAVYICTPWDYPENPDLFMRVLQTIDASSAHLINPLSLVEWTLVKTYLRDLEEHGAKIVTSIWFDDIDAAQIPRWFDALSTDKIVIKPDVGANAQDTYVLSNPVSEELAGHLLETFNERPFFVQPFMQNVQSEGEFSLFFFGGEYSHAILKTPEQGDFRTQEEHGADIKSITASRRLIEAAQNVLALVDPVPVYVRADFVRGAADHFLLMELELIEPSLYLRTDAGAADRFARAFDERFQVLAGK